jgi:hypothetical protein
MRKIGSVLFVLAVVCFAGAVMAAPAVTTYQVTGPVLEVTDSKIVVEKDKSKWEIARDAETKVTGELKVGAKVTIQYKMIATSATVKAEKAEDK